MKRTEEDWAMQALPSAELLEATHRFPGPYLFKAIGLVEDGFAARVVAAVREELRLDADPQVQFRESAGGRHVAVSITPVVRSASDVLAVYRRIQTLTGLVVLW
jgi:putative lipoic acid-binding regulatory protein